MHAYEFIFRRRKGIHQQVNPGRPSVGAFTLLELLTVVAVMAVLAALLIPALKGLQNQAKLSKCQSNLKQIVAAGIAYTVDNDGYFPVRSSPTDPTNPFNVGGRPGPAETKERPLNPYVANARDIFICPADTAPYPPVAGAPAWASQPFYKTESLGTSYFYNSYVGTRKGIQEGKQQAGLHNLRIHQITQPSKMVFFGDQDIRAVNNGGAANWKKYTLWWHAKPGGQLRANAAFVDGSVRLVDVVPDAEAEYQFFNN